MIYIVDDDAAICKFLEKLFHYYGFASKSFTSAKDYLASDGPKETTCLILDVQMPGQTGLELQDRLRAAGYLFPIILMTGYMDNNVGEQAARAGTLEVLQKPFDEGSLIKSVADALIHPRLPS